MYRVTVRGQASAISGMKFGSGWVHANLIDSLSTRVGFDKDSDRTSVQGGDEQGQLVSLKTGRRLVMFGPEGFQEAPKDHRLVIVMGASPEAFFRALDQSFGIISHARREPADSAIAAQMQAFHVKLAAEVPSSLASGAAASQPASQPAAGNAAAAENAVRVAAGVVRGKLVTVLDRRTEAANRYGIELDLIGRTRGQ